MPTVRTSDSFWPFSSSRSFHEAGYSSVSCRNQAFVPRLLSAFPATAHVVEEDSQGGSAGVTVAVVLVVIAAAALGAFLFCRKRVPLPAGAGESNFDNKLYFNNPLRVPVDAKGLVANIEQNEQAQTLES